MLDHERKNQASKARKGDIVRRFLFLLIFLLLVLGTVYFGYLVIQDATGYKQAGLRCAQHGYVEMYHLRGQYFCLKREHGTDIIVPLESLERGE